MSETLQTICIIEDDESVRRAVQRSIRSVGFETATFATAEEFLESMEGKLPRCLILDVNLPGLNGLELQGRLQAQGRNIPVVIITSFADEKVREQAFNAGVIAFLPKPFDEGALLQIVTQVVN